MFLLLYKIYIKLLYTTSVEYVIRQHTHRRSKMKISATKFEAVGYVCESLEDNGSKAETGTRLELTSENASLCFDGKIHHAEVYNSVIIDGKEYSAVYQTGLSYVGGDYSKPVDKLELSRDGGSHELLLFVAGLYERDFDDADMLEKAHGYCPFIKDIADLRQLYDFLMNNTPYLTDFIK